MTLTRVVSSVILLIFILFLSKKYFATKIQNIFQILALIKVIIINYAFGKREGCNTGRVTDEFLWSNVVKQNMANRSNDEPNSKSAMGRVSKARNCYSYWTV